MRVVIGEDSTLFREGLASLLTVAGHEVAGRAADAVSLPGLVDQARPDLVVIDVRMPPDLTDDGARAARTIRDRHPGLGIVLLSQHIETRHSVELVAAGGFGYLLKDRVLDVDDFMDALARVAAGGSALDPEVVGRLLGHARNDPLAKLTAREAQVLDHMAQGHTNARIAEQLHVSQSAVEKHVNAIFDKLDLSHVTGYSRRVLAILRYLGS